jgi:hypothetical protein
MHNLTPIVAIRSAVDYEIDQAIHRYICTIPGGCELEDDFDDFAVWDAEVFSQASLAEDLKELLR